MENENEYSDSQETSAHRKQNEKPAARTNANKVNGKQKEVLAQFMLEHPDLAKNKLQNCAQAKLKSQNLWRQLTNKLNAWGPPTKDVSSWRKDYADQKHNTKKKLSHNKASRKKTGGGPFDEKLLTSAEEQIMEAAGLTAAVAGLTNVKCFGSKTNQTSVNDDDITNDVVNNDVENGATSEFEASDIEVEMKSNSTARRQKNECNKNTKIELLKENFVQLKDWQSEIRNKLNKVIELKERSLKVKEEANLKLDKLISLKEKDIRLKQVEHDANMSSKEIDLQIKTLELQVLHQNSLRRE